MAVLEDTGQRDERRGGGASRTAASREFIADSSPSGNANIADVLAQQDCAYYTPKNHFTHMETKPLERRSKRFSHD